MNCSQALETMLDAESADLSLDGSSALAVHLRSCAKCARVAATMRADVRVLAAVMPAAPLHTKAPWIRWPGVALATAAAVLLFVAVRGRSVPTVHTLPAAATHVVAQPTEGVKAPTATPTAPAAKVVRKEASALYAMPDPVAAGVAAERQTRAPGAEPAFDGVSASSHGKVTVLATSNPKITIIWFN